MSTTRGIGGLCVAFGLFLLFSLQYFLFAIPWNMLFRNPFGPSALVGVAVFVVVLALIGLGSLVVGIALLRSKKSGNPSAASGTGGCPDGR